MFPQSPTIGDFWENIVYGRCAISDPPQDWIGNYALGPPQERGDRVGNLRGGYLGSLAQFDATQFGIPPNSIDGSEPEHFLALRVAAEALADADVPRLPLNRERTDVILGRSTFVNRGLTSLHQHGLMVHQVLTLLRQLHPDTTPAQWDVLEELLRSKLPPFNAQTSPGMVSSIMSGRIANRLDLGGRNYCVDGACASSLLAIEHAASGLARGTCDAALAGGVHVSLNPLVMMMFTQLGALSPADAVKPFSTAAGGTLLCEGVGVVVLKRLADAQRDGNRIYCVIKSVGTSSDGKAKSIVAPRSEGQELALRRAYELAAVDPQSVQLIEAHGTGMPLGDKVEMQSLARVFSSREPGSCALGSAKSNFGHALSAAGIAGFIKAALALYERTLPPTRCEEAPLAELVDPHSPLYLNTRPRPWLHGSRHPRRAGVNAFGFGGINAHAVLEEYPFNEQAARDPLRTTWDAELCVFYGSSRDELMGDLDRVRQCLDDGVALHDVAYTLSLQEAAQQHRLTIVAESLIDLREKIDIARQRLLEGKQRIKDRRGIFYFEQPLALAGSVAFVFPGEGAQYENMLADLCQHFPQVRQCFDRVETAFDRAGIVPTLSRVLYPPPHLASSKENPNSALWRMDYAVQSVTTANRALSRLFHDLGVTPHMMVGHSSGEFAALEASGALCLGHEDGFLDYIEGGMRTVQRVSAEVEKLPEVRLIAASAEDREQFGRVHSSFAGRMLVAMDNCPFQIIACGDPDSAKEWIAKMQAEGITCAELPFRRAYHTPWFAPACGPLREFYNGLTFVRPTTPLYSCASVKQYPDEPAAIRDLAFSQWCLPVRFQETVQAMYSAGARIFVEIGTRGNLASFISDSLRGQPHEAIRTNVPQRSGIRQLCEALGLLIAHHVPVRLAPLFATRRTRRLDWLRPSAPGPSAPNLVPIKMQLPLIELNDADLSELARHGFPTARPKAAAVREMAAAASSSLETRVATAAGKVNSAPTPATRLLVADAQQSNGGRAAEAVPPLANAGSPIALASGTLSPRAQAMARHLDVMSQFLAVQQSALLGFEHRRSAKHAVTNGSVEPLSSSVLERSGELPFVHDVVAEVPGREILIRRTLDVSEDLYLADHVLGGRVSMRDRNLTALPVNPLTMSVEMLAQVAARLMPGKAVLAVQNIRAHRWMVVENKLELSMKGECIGPDRVRVSIQEASPEGAAQGPIIEAEVVVGDSFASPPAAGEFNVSAGRPSRFTAEAMYKTAMFSGPRFQAIQSVQTWGQDGLIATLHSLPEGDLFRANAQPQLLTAPVLLDAAGQTVAHWNGENDPAGFCLFPYFVGEIRFYAPGEAPPPRLQSRLHIASTQPEGVNGYRANIRLVDEAGRLWAEIRDWRVKSFELPETFFGMLHDQIDVKLGDSWDEPLIRGLKSFAAHGVQKISKLDCVLTRVTSFRSELLLGHGGIWMRALARQIFSERELDSWRAMPAADARKVAHLLGRVAAKDAVRRLMLEAHGLQLCPGDIEIASEPGGAPVVLPGWWTQETPPPRVSISHSGDVAMAVAASADAGVEVGIDVERQRSWERQSVNLLFAETEKQLAGSQRDIAADGIFTRFWCAKEAVAKALRVGLGADPSSLIVRSYDAADEACDIEVGGHLGEMRPDLRGRRFVSQTEVAGAITMGLAFFQHD
jgi:acyl transferase domain-containing protein/phosphopantetheinyl transferase